MRMSFIIHMFLTIVKNSEFVEETLGKLQRSKIYERHEAQKHFKVGKNMHYVRLYFESLNETI